MNAKQYLKKQYNNKIKKLVLLDKKFESNVKLEQFYDLHFNKILDECHKILGLEYHKEISDYNEDELTKLKLIFIGMCVDIRHLTQETKCVEMDEIKNEENPSNYYKYIKEVRKVNEDKFNELNKDIIIPFLKKFIDGEEFDYYYKNRLKQLLIECGYKVKRSSVAELNKVMRDNNIPYEIVTRIKKEDEIVVFEGIQLSTKYHAIVEVIKH